MCIHTCTRMCGHTHARAHTHDDGELPASPGRLSIIRELRQKGLPLHRLTSASLQLPLFPSPSVFFTTTSQKSGNCDHVHTKYLQPWPRCLGQTTWSFMGCGEDNELPSSLPRAHQHRASSKCPHQGHEKSPRGWCVDNGPGPGMEVRSVQEASEDRATVRPRTVAMRGQEGRGPPCRGCVWRMQFAWLVPVFAHMELQTWMSG